METGVLAIDGGGTHCRIVLAMNASRVVVNTGPANISTDFDAAICQIKDGLHALATKSQLPLERLIQLPSFVGLAGVKSQEHIDRLRLALPLTNVRYAEDRAAAVRGALGDSDGCLVHCGTGSFFAMQLGGNVRYAGGWGAVLGDEASAAWIGRLALSLTLKCEDGFYLHSPLTQALLVMHDGADGIVAYASQAQPNDFGKLAPLVTEYALKNDSLAERILRKAADCINDGLKHLGWLPEIPLCLSGGIACACQPYLSKVQQAAVVLPINTPLEGAVRIALDFAQGQSKDQNEEQNERPYKHPSGNTL